MHGKSHNQPASIGISIIIMLTSRACASMDMRQCPLLKGLLASYLSRGVTSTLKAPALPSKPLKDTSLLNGRAYAAAGQAGAAMHTMSVLQAYQADLLKDLDQGQGN